jgi:putative ABC transport system substrate-binding protein
MDRRRLIALLGGALTLSCVAAAQQKAMPVIGFLTTGSATPGPNAPFMAAFRQGLSETGYVVGQNLAIEYRWAESRSDQLPDLASDLVRRRVDVIVTTGGPAPARAAKNATSTYRSSSTSAATRSWTAWSPVFPAGRQCYRHQHACQPAERQTA